MQITVIIVFAIFALLVIVLVLLGGILVALRRNKQKQVEPIEPQQVPPPYIEQGIPQEVVAAIAAAVTSMEDGRYTLHAVAVAKSKTTRRKNWGQAGVAAYTRPFGEF